MNLKYLFGTLVLALLSFGAFPAFAQQVLTGDAAFTDYTKEQPGVRRKVTVADLPQPYATPSANNAPTSALVPTEPCSRLSLVSRWSSSPPAWTIHA